MMTFICYSKCSTCQKAKAFLDHDKRMNEQRVNTRGAKYDIIFLKRRIQQWKAY